MPMLLEHLAEETTAANRRLADRIQQESELLRKRNPQASELQFLAARSARQATDYILFGAAQIEGIWRAALMMLRDPKTGASAALLLPGLLQVFESGRTLAGSARPLWEMTAAETASAGIDELQRAERQFEQWAEDARRAIEHRSHEWQPVDPDRLAAGLQMARAGKTLAAEDARARFGQPHR